MKNDTENFTCQVCKNKFNKKDLYPSLLVRHSITNKIIKNHPDWDPKGFICYNDLHRLRNDYIKEVLKEEKGKLSIAEQDVLKAFDKQELLTSNINTEADKKLTIGQKLADKVANFGGSWRFILTFGFIMFLWIIINSFILIKKSFDPYPFILLNLVLSCLAAIQAPIIMMSQNRQESKDRMRSEHDYRINLKSELEIRILNEKIDHLLAHQWHRLIDIQEIQVDIMEELLQKKE